MSDNLTSATEAKKNGILQSIKRDIAEEPTYAKEIKLLNVQKKYDNEQREEAHRQKLIELAKKYGISPKERATYDELVIMIGMVLDTGDSGTKVIRRYAESADKSVKWINEIAKPQVGGSFRKALHEYENNTVIVSMKENKVYIKRDILNNTVTGALTKLSKQVKVSKIIDDLKNEVAMLKKNLAAKVEGKDWIEEAQNLRDSGRSLQEIAELLGKSKSAVGKYTESKTG